MPNPKPLPMPTTPQGAFAGTLTAPPQPVPTMVPPRTDPLDYSAQYNTPIPTQRQAEFDRWIADQIRTTGRNPLHDRYDYDVNGYFLSGAAKDSRGHGTDLFKKPNHPTFSNESQYHGINGLHGGRWITTPGGTFYEPSPLNIQLHGAEKLRRYFQQVEPETQLLPPPLSPKEIGRRMIK